MNFYERLLEANECFTDNKPLTPKGIMVHSTGADNPNLCRYVGPDDGLLGLNNYNNHWNQPRPDNRKVCVHAFIGKLADKSVATYQTLPWIVRACHCGGSGNDTHLSFEMCEDSLDDAVYFKAVFKEATELSAYLCKKFKLDPMKEGVLIGHYEGHKRGIASNHSDPSLWFKKFGITMDDFRKGVKALL